MKNSEDIQQDISQIRTMMERSSRFLSLSGWSGVMAGLYALAGAYVAYDIFQFRPVFPAMSYTISEVNTLFWLAATVVACTLSTAFILSHVRAKKQGQRSWNASTRRMLTQLFIPLFGGGMLIAVLVPQGFLGLTPALTLIFYGISLVSASPFTFSELRALGIFQILLGLLSAVWVDLSLLLWATGFGILHIIYGLYIFLKYQR
jgi:hypothetical protein